MTSEILCFVFLMPINTTAWDMGTYHLHLLSPCHKLWSEYHVHIIHLQLMGIVMIILIMLNKSCVVEWDNFSSSWSHWGTCLWLMISSSNQHVDIQHGGFCLLLNFTAYACADWFCLLQAWLCMLSRKRCSVVSIIITIECWSYMLIICLCMNSSSFLGVVQVDLGTDAKHCFCKAGDLLAVVEWISAVAEDFRKINFLSYGVGCCCHFYI